jgi:hypothetical protein
MPSKKEEMTASPCVELLAPTAGVALLASKTPQIDEGGRVGPPQEDRERKDGGIDQCNDKVEHGDKLFGGGRQL